MARMADLQQQQTKTVMNIALETGAVDSCGCGTFFRGARGQEGISDAFKVTLGKFNRGEFAGLFSTQDEARTALDDYLRDNTAQSVCPVCGAGPKKV